MIGLQTGFLLKLIVCPFIVWISMYLFGGFSYPNGFQAVIVRLALAVLAHFMEILFLKRGTFWIKNVMDYAAAVIVLLASGQIIDGAVVTLLTAFIFAVSEYFQHLWLLKSGRTYKGVG